MYTTTCRPYKFGLHNINVKYIELFVLYYYNIVTVETRQSYRRRRRRRRRRVEIDFWPSRAG